MSSVVEASQQDVADHFKQFFNRASPATPITADFLRDFTTLSADDIANLNNEFDIDELRDTVRGMSSTAAVGAFGIDVDAIKLLLA